MFLEDELLQIGRNAELNEEGIKQACLEMIRACQKDLFKHKDLKDEYSIRSTFRRIDNTFMSVANILKEEGRGFIKPDGFRIFINSMDETKILLG